MANNNVPLKYQNSTASKPRKAVKVFQWERFQQQFLFVPLILRTNFSGIFLVYNDTFFMPLNYIFFLQCEQVTNSSMWPLILYITHMYRFLDSLDVFPFRSKKNFAPIVFFLSILKLPPLANYLSMFEKYMKKKYMKWKFKVSTLL